MTWKWRRYVGLLCLSLPLMIVLSAVVMLAGVAGRWLTEWESWFFVTAGRFADWCKAPIMGRDDYGVRK